MKFEPEFDPESEAEQFTDAPYEYTPRVAVPDLDIEDLLQRFHKTPRPELKARDHCCEEASMMSHSFYIPCNAPATQKVEHRGEGVLRMCEPCAWHNVENRGATLVGPYKAS